MQTSPTASTTLRAESTNPPIRSSKGLLMSLIILLVHFDDHAAWVRDRFSRQRRRSLDLEWAIQRQTDRQSGHEDPQPIKRSRPAWNGLKQMEEQNGSSRGERGFFKSRFVCLIG